MATRALIPSRASSSSATSCCTSHPLLARLSSPATPAPATCTSTSLVSLRHRFDAACASRSRPSFHPLIVGASNGSRAALLTPPAGPRRPLSLGSDGSKNWSDLGPNSSEDWSGSWSRGRRWSWSWGRRSEGGSLRSSVSLVSGVGVGMEMEEETKKAQVLVEELRAGFKSGRTKERAWRLEQLNGIVRMISEQETQLSEALAADLGKPAHEAFITELSQVRGSCKNAIQDLKKWMSPEKVVGTMSTYPSSAAIVSEPLGVTLVISAWNFPFLLSMDPLIGAIGAGCAIVLKPSEVAPAMSALLAKIIPLYLDSSVIRVVEGAIPETQALLQQKWDKIFYTGNPMVGRIVMTAAAKHLTPVTLELGGKCPAYVNASADLKVSLRRIAYGKWGNNNGQACIAPDYLLVDESIASEVVTNLKQTIVKFFGEDPKVSKDKSRIVNSRHFSRLANYLDDPRTSPTIVHGGDRDEKNLQIAPTLLCDPPMDVPVMNEEIFGPILPIIKVKGVQAAIDFINERPKPLAAYVFTNSKEVESQYVADVSSGGMVVNDTVLHFVVPGLPFGGVGESGMGCYHGKFSFNAFSHKKAVLYRSFGGDVSARYPPFTDKKKNFIRKVVDGDLIGAALNMAGFKE